MKKKINHILFYFYSKKQFYFWLKITSVGWLIALKSKRFQKEYKTLLALLIIIAFIHIPKVYSQTTYIVDSTFFQKIDRFYYIKDSTSINNYDYIDTSVLGFQNSLPIYFNGQIGTAQPEYLLENKDLEIGSRILNIYFPDEINKNNVSLWKTKSFFSKLEGIAGSKDEQHFRALFSSPIKKYSQINFYLRRSTNTGFYQNQKGSVTNLFADYHFFGRKKFSFDACLLLNYIKHQENGGIAKDTLSYNDLFLDKILIPVRLSAAKKNYQSHLLHTQFNYLINSHYAFSLSADLERKIFQYQDNFPMNGYYSFIFLDTLKTNDSLHSLKIDIPLSYTYRHRNTYARISYRFQQNYIHLFADTSIQNHIIELTGETFFKLFKHLKITHTRDIQYIFYGTQKDNYLIKFTFNVKAHLFQLDGLFAAAKQSPTFQQNYWYSNHFIWFNRFKEISTQYLSFETSYHSWINLAYHFFHHNNYIYFIDNYPQQYSNDLFIHQLKLSIDKVFFKHLGIKADYYYQWKSSHVIALPEHFVKADVYYQGRWFKKSLLVNTGTQIILSPNYFDTYQYNPATSVYSVMSNSFQAGNFPQLAFYFSGRIKPVNFFIRMDYLLSGLISQPYYYLPSYMMPDRSFRMGISWMFFD